MVRVDLNCLKKSTGLGTDVFITGITIRLSHRERKRLPSITIFKQVLCLPPTNRGQMCSVMLPFLSLTVLASSFFLIVLSKQTESLLVY